MKRKVFVTIISIVIILFLLVMLAYVIDHKRMAENKPVVFSTWGKKYAPPEEKSIYKSTENINFALTMNNTITNDTVWCGTFQLIWNDLKNDLAKQDIVFTPQLKIVENLNKGEFDTTKISDKYYYKVYGHPSIKLKEQIENEIKSRFNETSDILDDFNWDNRDPQDYFLYCMLRKDFQFETAFEELEKGTFANKYKDISYFGVKNSTKDKIKKQVNVLYYNSDNDFAIKLNTKGDDEVILCKGKEGKTFKEIYETIKNESNTFEGRRSLTSLDEMKIPNIKFKEKKELTELQDKPFLFSNGQTYKIEQAIQTIEFELDRTGGKIKSESGIMNKAESAIIEETQKRKFYLDNTFTLFLQEKGKDMPYFAATISDITKFQ